MMPDIVQKTRTISLLTEALHSVAFPPFRIGAIEKIKHNNT